MKARFITDDEIDFLRHKMGKNFLPFEVALQTGLRIGDVLKLRHQDISGNKIYFVSQKTGKAGVAVVKAALARRLREPNGSEWCFPGRDVRKPLTRQAAWARIKRVCEDENMASDGISPHSTRKAFAVRTLRAGGIEAVKKALQHSDLRTTEIYALSDWLTGENAELPLKRKDISFLIDEILRVLK